MEILCKITHYLSLGKTEQVATIGKSAEEMFSKQGVYREKLSETCAGRIIIDNGYVKIMSRDKKKELNMYDNGDYKEMCKVANQYGFF
jgi:hypothetical protein